MMIVLQYWCLHVREEFPCYHEYEYNLEKKVMLYFCRKHEDTVNDLSLLLRSHSLLVQCSCQMFIDLFGFVCIDELLIYLLI